MRESLLANPRHRQLLVGAFLIGASVAAGWSIYHGKLKVVAFLGLLTLGVFLRQATFVNAYLLTLLTASLGLVRFDVVKDEFDQDKWIALFAMAGVALAAAAFSIRNPPWPRPVHLLVLGLVGISVWSFSWSVEPGLSFEKAGVFALVMIIAFIGLWSWARTTDDVRRIAEVHVDNLWIVWPVGIASLVVLRGDAFLAGRFRAIFINPNNLGFWGSLTVPLLFAMTLTHPLPWRRTTCALMGICAWICVVLAGSRGGMIGALLGCGLYCLLRFPKPTIALGAALVTFVTFVALYGAKLEVPDSLQVIIRPDTIGDLSDRRIWWLVAVLIWQQRPWLGHGFGLTDRLFSHYDLDVGAPGTFGATVHNSYLEAAMNIGTVGLAFLVALLAWSAFVGFRTWWRDREGQTGLLSLALLCVLVAGSAHASIESTLFAAGNPWSLPFWVTVAMIHRLATVQAKDRAAARAAVRMAAVQPVAA